MPAPIPAHERRSRARLLAHYEREKELAATLRRASKEARRGLYTSVYDELFRGVPDHPQLAPDPAAARAELEKQRRFLERFLRPDTVFLEIGAGDCSLSLQVAARVAHVYAVDVSKQLTESLRPPANLEVLISDGCSIPVPPGSVSLAYSHQLMEHLHPDDARAQLHEIFTALAPGGTYLCVTPSRLTGPHDISGYFDDVATGLHLVEYTAGELGALFRTAGFERLRLCIGPGGKFIAVPPAPIVGLECLLLALPAAWRRRLAGRQPLRLLVNIVKLAATKPESRGPGGAGA